VINIVLADDHQVVRKGVKALLSSEADFNIVGEAGNGLETIEVVEKVKPDILVLDLMMPGLNGLEVNRQLSKKCPGTRTVVLSMHGSEAYVLEALRSGARAFVLKDAPPEELVHAIREAYAGRRFLSSPLSENAIEAYTRKTELTNIDPMDNLTAREREILQLTAQGLTNAAIGSRLFISPRTVETHRTNLMRKLELHNHAQLIQFAIQHGIIPGQT
jgi:DNA-binding NarL/FixJ family response regulator